MNSKIRHHSILIATAGLLLFFLFLFPLIMAKPSSVSAPNDEFDIAVRASPNYLSARADPDELALLQLDEGKVYRRVNDEVITGRDILNLLVEENWDRELRLFVEHILRVEETQAQKIEIAEVEVDAELQALLNAYAAQVKMDPAQVKLDKIARQFGGLHALRRVTKENLGLLRILQQEGKLPKDAHTSSRNFQEALRQRLEQRATEKGVITDPKRLNSSEAARVGARSFAREEVCQFMFDALRQILKDEFQNKIEILTLERLVQRALKDNKIEVSRDDLEFHFSYLCRRREAETGAPGRMIIRQDLEKRGLQPEQFLQSRLFQYDAGITCLARRKIKYQQLKDEFIAHLDRYKRNENLIAHIFVRVLDPDGRGYTSAWQAPGHRPVNEFVARIREERFAAAKPKIESLLPLARQDFSAVAKKNSDDLATSPIGGVLGRIGAETILTPPCDRAVRDAAIKLKPSEISEPIRSDYGWHLLKCLEKQDMTFEEAEERVYLNMLYEMRFKIDESLRKNAKIEER